ncbi:MAG: glycosyltransferase [Myxococcales bacterium]|nr:glycosyltransferase [Myxococcales bacterium]
MPPGASRRAGSVDVTGVNVDGMDVLGLLAAVDALVSRGRSGHRATVAYANVHVLNEAAAPAPAGERLRTFLNAADICYCDGSGVVLGSRMLGRALPERMTGADWIWDLARHAEGRHRLFWLGSEPGVTEAAAAALRERHPALHVVTDHGFHAKTGAENDALIARINEARPDIVLVGMGTPTQERWTMDNRAAIEAPVVWVLGATADFVSGKVSRGPAWLHRNQEWIARLVTEPRRLWRRYLIGNTTFLLRVARQAAVERARR